MKKYTALSKKSQNEIIKRYEDRFREFGYSPKTLGWNKGKQDIRFAALTKSFSLSGNSVLDIGCGFANLYTYLKNTHDIDYTGIDLAPALIKEAQSRNPEIKNKLLVGEFNTHIFSKNFDYIVGSGIFNHKINNGNITFIKQTMNKAFKICEKAVAFDFLSTKVEYQHEHTFHSSPEKILGFAYTLSRRVILDNTYMPFEFTVIIYKDDGFNPETTLYNTYE